MRITQPGERHNVGAADKPRHGPRGDVSHRRLGAGRRVEDAPLAFHRREIRCSKSLICFAVEEDRREREERAQHRQHRRVEAVVLLLRLVEDPERRRVDAEGRKEEGRPQHVRHDRALQRAPPGAASFYTPVPDPIAPLVEALEVGDIQHRDVMAIVGRVHQLAQPEGRLVRVSFPHLLAAGREEAVVKSCLLWSWRGRRRRRALPRRVYGECDVIRGRSRHAGSA